MGKLTVGLVGFLSLCAMVLLLPPLAASQSTQPSPGWYTNNGRGLIKDTGEWLIMWESSYIYQHPGTDNLYWYAQITYFNKSNKILTLDCIGEDQLPPVREHIIRGGTYLGYVDAEQSPCDGNQSWTASFDPGETYYDWVIFHNVPWLGDQVRIQWDPYGFSQWVNPWQSRVSNPPPQPAACPDELVKLGTCQPVSRTPEGKASNLIVLVHGCCTDANDVRNDWETFGRQIAGTIQPPGTWEIVVWDWSNYTPKLGYPLTDLLLSPRTAYENLQKQPDKVYLNLKDAIANHHYKNLHLIGHSTGAKLIQLTVEELVHIYKQRNEEPFIHLTFLDAFTLGASDKATYGFLPNNYQNHYSEHYVDRGFAAGPASTDECLGSAFNFDISRWLHSPTESLTLGHHWPIHWYQQSVTSTSPKFKYGYSRSFEGGNNFINRLSTEFPPGRQCPLITIPFFDENPECKQEDCWK